MGTSPRTLIAPGLAALVAVAAGRVAAAPACAVRVSGDEEPAAEIRTSLASRGVSDRGDVDCAPVTARVVRRGDGLRVEVVDGYGRRSRRDVRDAATAVALIESWVRPEVVEGDLPGAAPIEARAEAGAPAVVVGSGRSSPASGMAMIAGALIGGDSATWGAGGVAACGGVGPVCIGARLVFARDTRTTGPGFHPRSVVTAALTADVGWWFGRFAVIAGVAAGPSQSGVGGNGPHMDQTVTDNSLRVGGRVAVARRLSDAVSIELAVGGDAAAVGTGPGLVGASLTLRRGWR